MCSPPEQMKTSLWKGKMLKYVPSQFQGAVLHLLNIYFYKTRDTWVCETKKGSLWTEDCKMDEFFWENKIWNLEERNYTAFSNCF